MPVLSFWPPLSRDRQLKTKLLLLILLWRGAPAGGQPFVGVDADLQKVLAQRLDAQTACVVMDIQAGRILAVHQPEIALKKSLPIGSLIKPLLTYVALSSNQLKPEQIFLCAPGDQRQANPPCWYLPGHGRLDLVGGLAFSCNAYFEHVAAAVEITLFSDWLKTLDYRLPPALTRQDEIALMIGRSPRLQMTPLQILSYLSLFFNGGRLFDYDHPQKNLFKKNIPLDSEPLAWIAAGLARSFKEGTGHALQEAVADTALLVKTGTAPYYFDNVEDITKTHAWTIVFYPASQPRIGLIVFVKDGVGSKDGVQAAIHVLNLLQGQAQRRR